MFSPLLAAGAQAAWPGLACTIKSSARLVVLQSASTPACPAARPQVSIGAEYGSQATNIYTLAVTKASLACWGACFCLTTPTQHLWGELQQRQQQAMSALLHPPPRSPSRGARRCWRTCGCTSWATTTGPGAATQSCCAAAASRSPGERGSGWSEAAAGACDRQSAWVPVSAGCSSQRQRMVCASLTACLLLHARSPPRRCSEDARHAVSFELGWRRLTDPSRTASRAVLAQASLLRPAAGRAGWMGRAVACVCWLARYSPLAWWAHCQNQNSCSCCLPACPPAWPGAVGRQAAVCGQVRAPGRHL